MLLDSVVVIDHLNGVPGAEVYLEEVLEQAVVSVVTRAEVLTSYADEDWAIAEDLLNSFPALGIDPAIADAAARLRRDQRRLKLAAAFQAALAQHHGLRLATRNTRDFRLSDSRSSWCPTRFRDGREPLRELIPRGFVRADSTLSQPPGLCDSPFPLSCC